MLTWSLALRSQRLASRDVQLLLSSLWVWLLSWTRAILLGLVQLQRVDVGAICHFQHLLLLDILLNLLVPLMLVRGGPGALAVAAAHDAGHLRDGLGD